jgi:hypothetical protein
MSDGANLGVSAERALSTILGGKPAPEADECDDAAAVRTRIIAAAARGGEPTGYGDCADMVAGMVLAFYQARPEAFDWPGSPAHHWELNGEPVSAVTEGAQYVKDGPDLSREVDAFTDGKLGALGITGFQWGWAVNAARFAESLPPEPNPAIITVETSPPPA